jgi:delta 1-pyrroline-5-carboxylate dehydrogenase
MAGNVVVLKPSELTPLSTLLMARGMREAGLPDDLMSVVTGAGEAGAALVDAVDMVQFTGSTANGKTVLAQAASTLTPVSLVRDVARQALLSRWISVRRTHPVEAQPVRGDPPGGLRRLTRLHGS